MGFLLSVLRVSHAKNTAIQIQHQNKFQRIKEDLNRKETTETTETTETISNASRRIKSKTMPKKLPLDTASNTETMETIAQKARRGEREVMPKHALRYDEIGHWIQSDNPNDGRKGFKCK